MSVICYWLLVLLTLAVRTLHRVTTAWEDLKYEKDT
jgi:hypothetical protein